MGGVWEHYGALWVVCGSIMEHYGWCVGALWSIMGGVWEHYGALWVVCGSIMGSVWEH